jgi:hypothetical protein
VYEVELWSVRDSKIVVFLFVFGIHRLAGRGDKTGETIMKGTIVWNMRISKSFFQLERSGNLFFQMIEESTRQISLSSLENVESTRFGIV